MKQVTGYWFAPENNRLANGDNRKIEIGITHSVEGEIIPCGNGLHLSKHPFDALRYAPGQRLYRVRGFGTIVPHGTPIDKYACSKRKYIAGGLDLTKLLRKFACDCALDVINLWNAPPIVSEYLRSQNENKRAAAWSAAWEAPPYVTVAGRCEAWTAASAAAWASSWNVAWAAAMAPTVAAEITESVEKIEKYRELFKNLVEAELI